MTVRSIRTALAAGGLIAGAGLAQAQSVRVPNLQPVDGPVSVQVGGTIVNQGPQGVGRLPPSLARRPGPGDIPGDVQRPHDDPDGARQTFGRPGLIDPYLSVAQHIRDFVQSESEEFMISKACSPSEAGFAFAYGTRPSKVV